MSVVSCKKQHNSVNLVVFSFFCSFFIFKYWGVDSPKLGAYPPFLRPLMRQTSSVTLSSVEGLKLGPQIKQYSNYQIHELL